MASRNAQQTYYCLCGAGLCNVFTSHSDKNPGRLFITCPDRVRGCGLWQWLDEVRMCRCNSGICRVQKCKTSPTAANVGRRFYCCPRSSSVQVKGCGFFDWLDLPIENKEESTLRATTRGSTQLGALREYVEMKRAVTNEVCDAILEKMKDLKLDKFKSPKKGVKVAVPAKKNTLSLHNSSAPSTPFFGTSLKKVTSGYVHPRISSGSFKVVDEVDEKKQTNKDRWKGLVTDISDDQQDITRGKGMVDPLFQAPDGLGTHDAIMSSYDYISTGLRQYN